MVKTHQNPEFQVVRQNEANAKFFVASYLTAPGVTSPAPAATVYTTGNTSNWF